MFTLQSILSAWLVITACLAVIMAVDVILGWMKRPRADKSPDVVLGAKTINGVPTISATTNQGRQSVTIHYPMTDEQEAREERVKANDAKGIDTPIEDL